MSANAGLLPGRSGRRPIRLRVILVTGVIALLVAWFLPSNDASDIVEPAGRSATTVSTRAQPTLSTRVRAQLNFAQRAVSVATTDLFGRHSWYQAPPPLPAADPGPPPPPSAPPLPYTYLGQYERTGDKAVYFLVQGDSVYDVHMGDTLNSTYSVDGVQNGQLQFTYLPLQIKQALSIGSSQ